MLLSTVAAALAAFNLAGLKFKILIATLVWKQYNFVLIFVGNSDDF